VLGLELVVVLGVAVLLGGMAAHRFGVPAPVFLLLFGVLLGFVPTLSEVDLPPEVVILLFLPALLYWESLTTSLREIRSNLSLIALVSIGLVIVTAGAVAVVAHAHGMPWGPAWVLGAAVAPTDAAAVAALARALPHRVMTVLRAESLINDGTALVIYGLAVGITVGEQRLSPTHVLWRFLFAYAGGIAAGLLTAWLSVRVRRLLDDPLLENVVSLLTPFTAFLLAELVHASGVLAVVVGGLALSQVAPRIIRADTRQQSFAFWRLSTFALNCALFVLVGLQLPRVVQNLTTMRIPRALAVVGIISAVVIGVRFAWVFAARHLGRLLDRLTGQQPRELNARGRVVAAVAGFRGAVSLAAALAVPERLASGAPFPDRDKIVFVRLGSSSSPSYCKAWRCRTWCAGRDCRPTPPSRRNATSPRPWPPKKPSPRWTTSPPNAASTGGSSTGCAPSTKSTSRCCARTATRPIPTRATAPRPTSGRYASDCSTANGRRPSGSATNSASTTPPCGRSSRSSTPKRSGSRAGTYPIDRCAPAADQAGRSALRRPSVKCFRSGQRFDGRDHHQALHSVGELRVKRDERVSLELGQRDVLGVKRVGPSELVGDLPRDVLQDTISEQPNPQAAHVVELTIRVLLGHLTMAYCSEEQRQHLRASKCRSQELVLVGDHDLVLGHAKGHVRTDHVLGHSGPPPLHCGTSRDDTAGLRVRGRDPLA
jgi:CPA1 family monovalent cation:H+ antiporter